VEAHTAHTHTDGVEHAKALFGSICSHNFKYGHKNLMTNGLTSSYFLPTWAENATQPHFANASCATCNVRVPQWPECSSIAQMYYTATSHRFKNVSLDFCWMSALSKILAWELEVLLRPMYCDMQQFPVRWANVSKTETDMTFAQSSVDTNEIIFAEYLSFVLQHKIKQNLFRAFPTVTKFKCYGNVSRAHL
jgi:hypothetical protein